MRKSPSDAERVLWQRLRNRQLDDLKFRRQFPIGPFIADFACKECGLVVEVDGRQHDEAIEYDQARTDTLNAMGWRVIRFFAGDVVKNLNAVLRTIVFAARPSP